jgi:PAS domain S-box-containing protein
MCLAVSSIPIGIIGGIEGFKSTSLILIGLIFLVTFFVSLTISYIITRPLEKITDNIDEISKGKLDVTLEPSEIYEINDLTESLNRILASLKLAIHKVGIKKDEIFEEEIKEKKPLVITKPIFKKANAQQAAANAFSFKNKWSEKEFDAIFVFDEKANILDCNENMYKKLGYTKPELLALNISDIDVLESKKEILDKINKTKELGSITFKTIHKRKDGSAVLVHENLQYDRNTNEYKAIVREEHSSKK